MKPVTCSTCKNFKGDCGHHFVDFYGHTNWNAANESMWDGGINCPACYEPSEEFIKKEKEALAIKLAGKYSIEDLNNALKILEEAHGKTRS